MKFSYLLIKKMVPGIPPKRKLVNALNMHSFEADSGRGDQIEVFLPANRYSDAASHIGIAREASAIFNLKLKNPVKKIINIPQDGNFIDVKVEDKNLCPRYAARMFRIKKIGKSPAYIAKILRSCGLKPINNIVDVMNYVMLETGQPLHSFDADKIESVRAKGAEKKRIIVRKAKKGEFIDTLDNQRVILGPNALVIADSKKPLAIAGIKGGKRSGVSKGTRTIIVEAANFDPASIYRTSKRIKLATDASARFSHNISASLVDFGIDRATELLIKGGAELIDSVDFYPNREGDRVIEFDIAKYGKLIGCAVKKSTVKKYFRLLGFSIIKDFGNKFLVEVPPWRTDVSFFEDLAEEVARLNGYGELLPSAPVLSIKPADESDEIKIKDIIQGILTRYKFDEVYNYSFVREKRASSVEIENYISKEFRYLRTDLETGLLKNINHNLKFFDDVRIFEIGSVFNRNKNGISESSHVGIAVAAKKQPQNRLIAEAKGVATGLLNSIGLMDFEIMERRGVLWIESYGKMIGNMKTVGLKNKNTAVISEFDIGRLVRFVQGEREYAPLSRFPAVIRDVSILAERNIKIGDIAQFIQESSDLIEDVDLVDEYGNYSESRQSLTFRIVFQAKDKTLKDSEVNKEMDWIIKGLKNRFRAEIR